MGNSTSSSFPRDQMPQDVASTPTTTDTTSTTLSSPTTTNDAAWLHMPLHLHNERYVGDRCARLSGEEAAAEGRRAAGQDNEDETVTERLVGLSRGTPFFASPPSAPPPSRRPLLSRTHPHEMYTAAATVGEGTDRVAPPRASFMFASAVMAATASTPTQSAFNVPRAAQAMDQSRTSHTSTSSNATSREDNREESDLLASLVELFAPSLATRSPSTTMGTSSSPSSSSSPPSTTTASLDSVNSIPELSLDTSKESAFVRGLHKRARIYRRVQVAVHDELSRAMAAGNAGSGSSKELKCNSTEDGGFSARGRNAEMEKTAVRVSSSSGGGNVMMASAIRMVLDLAGDFRARGDGAVLPGYVICS